MHREELSALAALHARCIENARRDERAARRLRLDDPHRAELSADMAAEWRAEAAALAKLLAPHGVEVRDPRQLALLSDGGPS